jgi:hypothetical protein
MTTAVIAVVVVRHMPGRRRMAARPVVARRMAVVLPIPSRVRTLLPAAAPMAATPAAPP